MTRDLTVPILVAIGCCTACGEQPARPGCGDGVVSGELNEQCDDGNTVDGDGCSSTCRLEPVCGNGEVETGEECDDGNTVEGDGCSPDCLLYPEQDLFDDLVGELEALCLADDVPGCAMAVVRDGELSYAAGVGVKEVGTTDPITPDTLFELASTSKMFCAATALALAEEGKLDLHEPITTYLPSFGLRPPSDPKSITMHRLLTHTSGYPNVIEYDFMEGVDRSSPDCPIRFFEYYNDEPLWSPSGRLFNYSNVGYTLAGAVVSAASGEPYRAAVARRVLYPAGIPTATYADVEQWDTHHSMGHLYDNEGHLISWKPSFENYCYDPMGGLSASVRHLGRFLETMLANDGRVLTAGSIDTMTSPLVDTGWTRWSYGYGVFITDHDGTLVLSHTGREIAFTSYLLWVPDGQFGAVVLTNAGHGGFAMYGAMDRLLADFLDLPDPPDPVVTDPSTWSKYEGTYVDPNFWGTMEVTADATELQVTLVDIGSVVAFTQVDGDTFRFLTPQQLVDEHWMPEYVLGTFWLDAQAQGEYFATRYGVAVRVPTP